MASVTRSSILTSLVIILILITAPAAVRRLVQTGDLYLFGRQFFEDMLARLSGPGRLRFLLQPLVAIILGARDGVKDEKLGFPPYVWALLFHDEHRQHLIRGGFASVRDLVAIAILLDIASQFLIFREIHPAAALVLGPVLIGLPYALSRGCANRIHAWRREHV